ncbi:hypothetical protein [Endozoicomonas atrinae]|uniref:hypothetical protein n=1 Tax=Endozoicomonas atrinae TaxID=1333660 RepID=UPI001112DF68|nr:hypothetical protein [Endozoicomonas atrinae]
MHNNNNTGSPPTDQDLEKIKAQNRKKYPELARVVDQLAETFGPDQVKVVHMEGDWSRKHDGTADDGATHPQKED